MNDQLRTNLTNLSQKFEQQYNQLKNDLHQWHFEQLERIDEMYLNTLILRTIRSFSSNCLCSTR